MVTLILPFWTKALARLYGADRKPGLSNIKVRLPTTRFKTLSLSFGRKRDCRTRKVRLWQILTAIPSATWKSMSRVLRVDRSIKDKPMTFAIKAAKEFDQNPQQYATQEAQGA